MMINLAKEFNVYPAGRDENDGDFHGKLFREKFLVPRLKELAAGDEEKLTIAIDGVRSYGSSFIEEAFGGLVRLHSFTKTKLRDIIVISYSNKSGKIFDDLVWRSIDEATASDVPS